MSLSELRSSVLDIRNFVGRELGRDLRLDEMRSIDRMTDADLLMLASAIRSARPMATLMQDEQV